jgi:hypothetical protein
MQWAIYTGVFAGCLAIVCWLLERIDLES